MSKARRYDGTDLATRIVRTLEAIPGGFLALIKTWQGVLIVLFIAIQVALPITYYTMRRDAHDERFAWRMFSPMRMTKCVPKLTVDGKPVDLAREFHEAWIEIAKRGRFVVIEKMGAKLCEKHPNSQVHVVVECHYLDRPDTTWGGYDMCKVPEL